MRLTQVKINYTMALEDVNCVTNILKRESVAQKIEWEEIIMKKRLLMCFLLCVVLTACGEKKENSLPQEEEPISSCTPMLTPTPTSMPTPTPAVAGYDGSEVTIVFYHTLLGKNLQAVLNDCIDDFNRYYPNITIEHYSVGSYHDVCNQISTEITVGNQPNVAYCYPEHVALYNTMQVVVPLDDFIESDILVERADGSLEYFGLSETQKGNFIPGLYQGGKQYGDGRMYTLPFSKTTEVLYYNKTFFEEHGLKVPATWDEMEAVCARIKEIDPTCIPLGYDDESSWFITACEQQGVPCFSETEDHYLFDNATARGIIKEFRNWYQNGYLTTQNILGLYTSSLFTSYSATKCYMSIANSASARFQRPYGINGQYPFEVGIAMIPQYDPENPKIMTTGPDLCIFQQGNPQEVAASWLFVKYLTTNTEAQAMFSYNSGFMPVTESVLSHAGYLGFLSLADGGDGIQALALCTALAQWDAYFAVPAFSDLGYAKLAVGNAMVDCLIADSEVEIRQIFKNAIFDLTQ